MRTLATKQPTHDSAKQKQSNRGRSHSVSPLSTGILLLQRKCACGGGCPRCQAEQDMEEVLPIQTKLKISQPGDKYEQEADRVAEQMMRMPEPTVSESGATAQVGEGTLQTKSALGQHLTGSLAVSPSIISLQGGGQPLPQSERDFFEPRFGADFSHVRIHTGNQAAEMAHSVTARAFTVGQDIVFGAEEQGTGSAAGRKLLAHELTHTLQQCGSQSKTPPLFSHPRVELRSSEPLIMRTPAGDLIDHYTRITRVLGVTVHESLNEEGLGNALRSRIQEENYSSSSIALAHQVFVELSDSDEPQVAFYLINNSTPEFRRRVVGSGESGRRLFRWVRRLLREGSRRLSSRLEGDYNYHARLVSEALEWAESRQEEAQPPIVVTESAETGESEPIETEEPALTEEEAPASPRRLEHRWEVPVPVSSDEPRILIFSFPVTLRRARHRLGLEPLPSPEDTSEVRRRGGRWLTRHFGEQEGPIIVVPAQSTEETIDPESRETHTHFQVMVWTDWREATHGTETEESPIRSVSPVEYRFRAQIQPERSVLSYGDRQLILVVNRQLVRSQQPFAYEFLPSNPLRNYPIIRLVVSPGVSIQMSGFPRAQIHDETNPQIEIYRVQDPDQVPTQGEPIQPSRFVGFEDVGQTEFIRGTPQTTTIRRRSNGVDITHDPTSIGVSLTVDPRSRTDRFAYEVLPPEPSAQRHVTHITVVATPSTTIRVRGLRPGEYPADPLIRLYEASFLDVPAQGQSLSPTRERWHSTDWSSRRWVEFEPEPLSQIAATSAVEIAIGAIPIVGDLVDIAGFAYGLFTGQDIWGRPLTVTDLSLLLVGALIPFVGAGVLRAGGAAVRSADEITELAQTIGRSPNEASELVLRVGRLAPEDQAQVNRWNRMIRRGEEIPEEELSEIQRILGRIDEDVPAVQERGVRAQEGDETTFSTASGTGNPPGGTEGGGGRPGRPIHRGATAEGVGESFQYEYHPEVEAPIVERRRVRQRISTFSTGAEQQTPLSDVEGQLVPFRPRRPGGAQASLELDEETRRLLEGSRTSLDSEDIGRLDIQQYPGRFRTTERVRSGAGRRPRRGRVGEAAEEELSLLQAEFSSLPAGGWLREPTVLQGVVQGSRRRPSGSTSPDLYHPGTSTHPPISLDAKSYLVDDVAVGNNPELMQIFLERTVDQARRRARALPENAEQHLLIDIRGQDISSAVRDGIRRDLGALSDGILQQARIRFLLSSAIVE